MSIGLVCGSSRAAGAGLYTESYDQLIGVHPAQHVALEQVTGAAKHLLCCRAPVGDNLADPGVELFVIGHHGSPIATSFNPKPAERMISSLSCSFSTQKRKTPHQLFGTTGENHGCAPNWFLRTG